MKNIFKILQKFLENLPIMFSNFTKNVFIFY